MEILLVIPVANARCAESIIHHMLARFRNHNRHELFNLTDNLHLLEHAKQTVQALDVESGLPVPQARPVSIAHWQVARQAAQEGARWQKRKEAERQVALLQEEKSRMKERDNVVRQGKNAARQDDQTC